MWCSLRIKTAEYSAPGDSLVRLTNWAWLGFDKLPTVSTVIKECDDARQLGDEGRGRGRCYE